MNSLGREEKWSLISVVWEANEDVDNYERLKHRFLSVYEGRKRLCLMAVLCPISLVFNKRQFTSMRAGRN